MPERKEVTIYTDGGCEPNPGPGGYGVVLLFGAHRKELSGGFCQTTNNRMELYAAIQGLKALREPCKATLYSDSEYLVNAIMQGWAKRWKERGWMRNSKEPAINPDLWEQLLTLCEEHEVTFVWLKGHAGAVENERCDQLAMHALQLADLPRDPGYDNRAEIVSQPVRVVEEGQPCSKCGTPVVKRKPRKQPKVGQEYVYAYYLLCPNCGTTYTTEEAKKSIEKPPSLF